MRSAVVMQKRRYV